jgi:hypothetical protein
LELDDRVKIVTEIVSLDEPPDLSVLAGDAEHR